MANDSDKAQPTKGTKHRYQREDLIWEAVRRNELYKKDYYQLLWEKCIEIVNCKKYLILYGQIVNNMLLFYNHDKYINDINRALESFKWQKLSYFILYLRWKMLWLFNSDIDIDDIKDAIASNQLKEKDHPYHHIYQQKRYPVIQFEVFGSNLNQKKRTPKHYFLEHDDDRSLVCVKKDILEDRLIISVDPMADDAKIKEGIIEIIRAASRIIKEKLVNNIEPQYIEEYDEDEGEDNGRDDVSINYYNPSDIESHIRWLTMYDTVIVNFLKNNQKNRLTCEKGALILPKERALFQQLVPDSNKESDKTANDVRKWKAAYNEAIKLIQFVPNIRFTRSRS